MTLSDLEWLVIYWMRNGRLVSVAELLVRHTRRFGVVGNDVGQINEVALRRARLVLGWVTVSAFNSRCGKFISV